jgi:hypothetical protein
MDFRLHVFDSILSEMHGQILARCSTVGFDLSRLIESLVLVQPSSRGC